MTYEPRRVRAAPVHRHGKEIYTNFSFRMEKAALLRIKREAKRLKVSSSNLLNWLVAQYFAMGVIERTAKTLEFPYLLSYAYRRLQALDNCVVEPYIVVVLRGGKTVDMPIEEFRARYPDVDPFYPLEEPK